MKKILIFMLILFLGQILFGGIRFTAENNLNDDGSSILINWQYFDLEPSLIVLERSSGEEDFLKLTNLELGASRYMDGNGIKTGKEYYYRLMLYDADGILLDSAESSAVAKAEWFNTEKISLLIMGLIISIAISAYIYSAKQGKNLYIRKIAGLESMEESVGRATEMGRPILYIPGTLDLDDMQTIAGLTILGKLAQKAAEYDARLIVPVCRSMVLSTAKEIVKEAYLKAGRPDAYDPDSVFYLTDDQFGYVAGVDGIIVREKPAANFFLGAFYAESLILAETGFASGAVQTSGTAMPSQLPFFVVACDYTLIGEELFAAS
ncbi:MAG: hypothetical protein JW996_04610, partial [Candidatus Cloacimonetes bacterium]|nr:hypothetical protein [Candidatus Cloacimonadota bacterium]